MIGQNGIINISNFYESDGMYINTQKSGSYTPKKDTNNSCMNIARVSGFVEGKQYYVELTVKWSGFTTDVASNFKSYFQGSTYNGSAWGDWSTSNPLANAVKGAINLTTVFQSADSGEKRVIALFTASSRTGYDLGIRTNYSNGIGTVSVSDLKILPFEYYNGTTMNLFQKTYTKENPYILTGNSTDIYNVISDCHATVESGKTYYLSAKSDKEWSHVHIGDSAQEKATVWLYLAKDNTASYSYYDSPILFTANNMISDGLWKYTIPSGGYTRATFRVNSYSNGTDNVTVKFWDMKLIPEEYGLASTPPHGDSTSYFRKLYIRNGVYGDLTHCRKAVS